MNCPYNGFCASCPAKRGVGASGRSLEMGVQQDAPTNETIDLPPYAKFIFI
jgi:hypothetical protein